MFDNFYGLDLIDKYSDEKSLTEIINTLIDYRKDSKTRQKYINLTVHLLIKLGKLEEDIKNMSKNEVKNKRLDYLKNFS